MLHQRTRRNFNHSVLIDRQIPSILSYIEGEEYQGTQAKSQLVRNSKNTVAYFRDYLGKEYVQGLLNSIAF